MAFIQLPFDCEEDIESPRAECVCRDTVGDYFTMIDTQYVS